MARKKATQAADRGVDYRLPSRYRAAAQQDEGVVTVTDTSTGRSTTIPLELYGPLSNALAELLSDEAVPVTETVPELEPTPPPAPAPTKGTPRQRKAKAPKKTQPKKAQPKKSPPKKASKKKSAPKKAPKKPPAWVASEEAIIKEEGFKLRRVQVPDTPYWGFEVMVGNRRGAYVVAEGERRWVVKDVRSGGFDPSVHRNLIGAIAKISAVTLDRIRARKAA